MSQRIAVIGAGVMGAGIGQVMAIAGYDAVCIDVSAEALVRARATVDTGRYGVRSAVERGKLTAEQADGALARLSFSSDLDAVADADVIIEAVPERLELKVALFRDLDRRCKPDAILASNSSGFPVAALAAATDRPDRVVGWHWASPVPVMKLAEIVRGPGTSDETVEVVVALAAAAGKNPVVIKDAPMSWGYVSNRVYFAMVREAHRVVQEGVASPEQVDALMMDCFRWPVGPFAMSAGAGTGWK